ncbi:MAG TPA: hypothetical protein VFQ48_09945 [Pseudonocardiaceae bacterium]|jgi:hypothetical protein|nr:hypothetical protein [Pseudonocardiaceae bacterium]
MAKLKNVGVREFRDHATTYLSGSDTTRSRLSANWANRDVQSLRIGSHSGTADLTTRSRMRGLSPGTVTTCVKTVMSRSTSSVKPGQIEQLGLRAGVDQQVKVAAVVGITAG